LRSKDKTGTWEDAGLTGAGIFKKTPTLAVPSCRAESASANEFERKRETWSFDYISRGIVLSLDARRVLCS